MAAPAEYLVSETLRNGLPVTIRALRAGDREKVASAIRELDRDSIYMRLFSYRNLLTEAALDRVMHFDPDSEVVLIVTRGSGADEVVIGSGRYIVQPANAGVRSAEVAFMVEEDYHGLGIASRLLKHLAEVARSQGIATFDATVLAENKAMLSVFARSGLPMRKRNEGGEVCVTLTL
ncbi:MAG TPA: GNAT family N-acetyltransferase [Casimicrobiaceae bacterium]|nr:GNAT family N-acetyltransferase [Casimicrobiaceae bacterium]